MTEPIVIYAGESDGRFCGRKHLRDFLMANRVPLHECPISKPITIVDGVIHYYSVEVTSEYRGKNDCGVYSVEYEARTIPMTIPWVDYPKKRCRCCTPPPTPQDSCPGSTTGTPGSDSLSESP